MIERARSRRRARGVTLVEVLIVVAIMAAISGVVGVFAIPMLAKSRVRTAAMGASAVREAAKVYREIDLEGDGVSCPTVDDLVRTKKLEAHRVDDPWGSRYQVLCEEDGELHGLSSGKDRRPHTRDDVRDDVKGPDVERISEM
jgi:general secretion pathway protein G